MKASFEVKNRKEADAIRVALNDPVLRAAVIVFGMLSPLDQRARRRALDYVADKLNISLEWRRP